jgi:hypothetical protein
MEALNNISSRRQWLKSGALFVPAVFAILKARGDSIQPGPIMRPMAAVGGGCPDDASPSSAQATNDSDQILGGSASNSRVGQGQWQSGTARTICKLGFMLSLGAGTITSKTYRGQIWTMTGYNLTTMVADSADVNGSQGWSSSWVYFTLATPYLISTSTNYGLVCACTTAVDGSNYANLRFASTEQSFSGYKEIYNNQTAQTAAETTDTAIRIYWT